MPRKEKKEDKNAKKKNDDKGKGKSKNRGRGRGKGKKEEPPKETKDAGQTAPPASSTKTTKNTPSQASSTNLTAAASSSAAPKQAVGGLTHMGMLSLPNLTDVTFQTTGKSLSAHLMVLGVRCPHLSDLAKSRAKKRRGFFVPIAVDLSKQGISDATMQVILDFIYGDNLQFSELDPLLVLHTCVAAQAFKLGRLVRLCHDHLRASLDLSSIYKLLAASRATNEETVFKFCMNYAHGHLKEFVHRREDVASLGMELFQDVVQQGLEDYKEMPADTSDVPPSTLVEDFRKLYNITVQMGEGAPDALVTLEGKKIGFHKAVLAAHTQRFAAILTPNPKQEDVTEVVLKNIKLSADSFQAMLQYIYFGNKDIEPLVAGNLAPFCNQYGMSSLQQICESHVAGNLKPDNVISALAVAYRSENMERADMKQLRQNGVEYVLNNIKDINVDPLRELDIQIAVDILQAWRAK